MRQIIIVVLSLMCVALVYAGVNPGYLGCLSNDQCGKGHCCLISGAKYSVPLCKRLGELGDSCRPDATPENVTLVYPNNDTVHLNGVYYFTCPCLGDLSCERDESGNDSPRCMDRFLQNHLYKEDYD